MPELDKLEEAIGALVSLGYSKEKAENAEVRALDTDRWELSWPGGKRIGIYDFTKHTFVD